jgi:hypothetical protein
MQDVLQEPIESSYSLWFVSSCSYVLISVQCTNSTADATLASTVCLQSSEPAVPDVCCPLQDRARLSIWHIRPQPAGAAAIGSACDLPALSPFGLGPMRTPIHGAAAALGAVGTTGSLPTFGTVNSAGAAAAGTQAAGLGSAGAYGGAAAAAAGAAPGYVGGPAAYSGSMLGMLASGGVTPWSGPGSFARMSVGASTVKR